MLEVRLLGAFEIRAGGRLVDLPSRPAQSLFAYLILNAGSLHRRERLAGLLWPASTEESARNNLRQALWKIRAALTGLEDEDRPYLLADNFTIGFNREASYHLDVAKLEEDADQADSLIAVVAAYGGELLPGFYEDWVVLERERVRALYERRIQRLLDLFLQQGRWAEAQEWAERWIALGTIPEAAYRAIMVAEYGQGDRAAAAGAFRRCADALQRELGVGPSLQTEQIYSEITEGTLATPTVDAGATADGVAPVLPGPVPSFLADEDRSGDRPAPLFVGRERELSRLTGLLERSLSGEGISAIIVGEAGIGKTALLRRFALQALSLHPDLVVASGSGNALTGAGDPYLPFRDVLAMLTGEVEPKWAGGLITREEARRLWHLLPLAIEALLNHGPDLVGSILAAPALLARARSHADAAEQWLTPLQRLVERSALRPADAALRQKDLHEQFTRVLQWLARHHPLVLILDDLQWADEDSLGLLFHLARRTPDHRILVLGAARSAGAETEGHRERRWLNEILVELQRTHGEVLLDLGSDAENEARKFVDDYLDSEPNRFDDVFRSELLRHTGGHPLFTVELLRAMEARGDIVRDRQGRWVRGRDLSWDELPGRVEGVIEERLRGLDGGQLEILQLACVEGEEFTAEVISRVRNAEAREVVGRLSGDLDRRHRLVSALGSRFLGEARLSLYRFRHILFQRHLYGRLDAVQRGYMHQDVGNALEAIYGERVAEIAVQLAHQFSMAGLARKAVTYLQEAAERAKRISAHTEAVSHLTNALRVSQSLPEGQERRKLELELQTSLGVSLSATRGYASPEVEEAFSRARALCHGLEGTPPLFPALYGLRAFYLARADYATAHELGVQLLTIAETSQDRELQVEAHQALGTTLFYTGDLRSARGHLENCLSRYDIQRDFGHAIRYGQDPAVACHSYLSVLYWLQGEVRRAGEEMLAAIAHAERIAHPFSMTLALIFAALLTRERGRRAEAQEYARAAEAICSENGYPFWRAVASILGGILQVEAGEPAGLPRISEGLAGWQETGSQLGRSYFSCLLASALFETGEKNQAMQLVEDALAGAQATGERLNLAELHRVRALMLADAERSAEAERALRISLDIARAQGAVAYELRAALSMARLCPAETRAFDLLWDAMSRLPEGAEGPDVDGARLLLER